MLQPPRKNRRQSKLAPVREDQRTVDQSSAACWHLLTPEEVAKLTAKKRLLFLLF